MANYVKETKSEGKTAIKTNIITLALMVITTIIYTIFDLLSYFVVKFYKKEKGLLVYTTFSVQLKVSRGLSGENLARY